MDILFDYAAGSDIGLVRTNNEDNLFVPGAPMKDRNAAEYYYNGTLKSSKSFFCVCDGMGGHNAGEIASDFAANQVHLNYETILNSVTDSKTLVPVMNNFVSDANINICGYSEQNLEFQNMGTTMCGIFFLENAGYCVNVGDSRLYMLNGRKVEQLSVDHADSEQTNALTRYLGMPEEFGEVIPDVSPFPVKIGSGKRFLLCSDGLCDMLGNDSIATVLCECKQPAEAVAKLIEEAKRMGGRDNITVIVIDAKPGNAVVRVVKKPVFIMIVAALLVGASIGGYTYYKSTAPVEGDALSSLSQSIATAKDLKAVQESLIQIPQTNSAEVSSYKDFCSKTADVSGAIINAKAHLNAKIAEAEASISAFNNELNLVISNQDGLSEEQLLEKQKAYQGWISYSQMSTSMEACKSAKADLENKISAYNAEQERIKSQNKNKSDSGSKTNGGSGNKSGAGKSGTSSGSSGTVKPSSNSGSTGDGSSEGGSSPSSGGSSTNSGGGTRVNK